MQQTNIEFQSNSSFSKPRNHILAGHFSGQLKWMKTVQPHIFYYKKTTTTTTKLLFAFNWKICEISDRFFVSPNVGMCTPILRRMPAAAKLSSVSNNSGLFDGPPSAAAAPSSGLWFPLRPPHQQQSDLSSVILISSECLILRARSSYTRVFQLHCRTSNHFTWPSMHIYIYCLLLLLFGAPNETNFPHTI